MNRAQRRAKAKRSHRHGGRVAHAVETFGLSDEDLIARELGFGFETEAQMRAAMDRDPEMRRRVRAALSELIEVLKRENAEKLEELRLIEEELERRGLADAMREDVERTRRRIADTTAAFEDL